MKTMLKDCDKEYKRTIKIQLKCFAGVSVLFALYAIIVTLSDTMSKNYCLYFIAYIPMFFTVAWSMVRSTKNYYEEKLIIQSRLIEDSLNLIEKVIETSE